MHTFIHFSDWMSLDPSSVSIHQMGLDTKLASQGVVGFPLLPGHASICFFDAVKKGVDDFAKKNLDSSFPISKVYVT